MTELGYRETVEMQSRAASALPLESAPPSPPTPEETGPTEEEVRDEMEKQTQEQLGALSLQHMEQMKQLQLQYEYAEHVFQVKHVSMVMTTQGEAGVFIENTGQSKDG